MTSFCDEVADFLTDEKYNGPNAYGNAIVYADMCLEEVTELLLRMSRNIII